MKVDPNFFSQTTECLLMYYPRCSISKNKRVAHEQVCLLRQMARIMNLIKRILDWDLRHSDDDNNRIQYLSNNDEVINKIGYYY